MENIPVIMIMEDLSSVPAYELPDGYNFRTFIDGDETNWAEVKTAAGEFNEIEKGLAQLEEEFGKYPEELRKRCIFLENANKECIGTAMGWFDDSFFRTGYGRVHWVGIKPDFQGKGLAKPLVSKVMEIIKENHTKAYLTTQTESYKAIKIYLDFGFKPFIKDETCPKAWKIMADLLKHPALSDFK